MTFHAPTIPEFFRNCTPLTFYTYRWASKLHGEQGYLTPRGYMAEHVLPVALVCAHYTQTAADAWDEDVVLAALLHDVLEDTDCTMVDVISQGIPLPVCEIVQALTQPKGQPRKVRVQVMLEHIAAQNNWRTLLVKLADRLVNVSTCHTSGNQQTLKMYQREYPQFRAVLHPLCVEEHAFPALWAQLDELHKLSAAPTTPL